MTETKKILAVFAHADDETLGTAGTLAHYTKQNVLASAAILTNGDKGRRNHGDGEIREGKNEQEKQELVAIRKTEASVALGLLGVSSIHTWDDVPTRELVPNRTRIDRMKKLLLQEQPTVVLGFHEAGTTLHQDHIASAFIVYLALTELLQAQLLPSFLRYLVTTIPEAPNMLEKYGEIIVPSTDLTSIDVNAQLDRKKQAAYVHQSQKHIIEALDNNGVLDIKKEFFLERISRRSSTARGKNDLFVGADVPDFSHTIHPMPLHVSRYMVSDKKIFATHLQTMLGAHDE